MWVFRTDCCIFVESISLWPLMVSVLAWDTCMELQMYTLSIHTSFDQEQDRFD